MTVTTYEVTLGDRVLNVTLRTEDGRLYAHIGDGEERPVELTTVRNTLRAVAFGPERLELLAERAGDGVLIALNGLQYRATVADAARQRLVRLAGGGRAQHQRRELKAPMPGLVVRVLCEAGSDVQAGQPLVVLQAMKMENELGLPQSGTVKAVSVEPGQTVEQGQTLLVLE